MLDRYGAIAFSTEFLEYHLLSDTLGTPNGSINGLAAEGKHRGASASILMTESHAGARIVVQEVL